MTYLGFLLRFLIPPLIVLALLTLRDYRSGVQLPDCLNAWPAWMVVAAHVVVAVVYTTPWDNYLVATRVWWYEPEAVSGIILGWVPLEEYLFFILQTLLTSLWLLWLARRIPVPAQLVDAATPFSHPARVVGLCVAGLLWISGAGMLALHWRAGAYLGLLLCWALAPIVLQLLFGADILWRHRWLVLAALLPAWCYLAAADAAAIGLGVWIIAPDQSVGLGLGRLPLEELLFFLLTNTLVVFGVVLVLARESQARAPAGIQRMLKRFSRTDSAGAARTASR